MKLPHILRRANHLKGEEAGLDLPENPTLDDFKREIFRLAQNIKAAHNEEPWSDKDWRKISAQVEEMEKASRK